MSLGVALVLLKGALLAAFKDPVPASWQLSAGDGVCLGIAVSAAVVAAGGVLQALVQ